MEADGAALDGLAGGGTHVNIGGVVEQVRVTIVKLMMTNQRVLGANWMTSAEAVEMTALVAARRVDLSAFEHVTFTLDEIDHPLDVLSSGSPRGGCANYVVVM